MYMLSIRVKTSDTAQIRQPIPKSRKPSSTENCLCTSEYRIDHTR